jgi:CheY-like chemotaxis protein
MSSAISRMLCSPAAGNRCQYCNLERSNCEKEIGVCSWLESHVESAMTRILVIDDDLSIGAAIQLMLVRQGCETVFVQDADAGVRAFESSKFDAVMVDIFMPGMDGLETIKGFRERSPTIPIVAMSGFRFRNSKACAPNYLEIAAKLGATFCLRKPFTPEQLMVAINSGLDPAPPRGHVAATAIPEQGSAP